MIDTDGSHINFLRAVEIIEARLKREYQEYVSCFYSGAIHGDRPLTWGDWLNAQLKQTEA